MARYKGQALGALGDLGTYSFHETKNITSGEGGCLLVNRPDLVARAEVMREKGTDRSRFFRGEVDKYTWQDIGSSFLPGELTAAFLWAQLEEAEAITQRRLHAWQRYHHALSALEGAGRIRRPVVPAACEHNAHMYYVLLAPEIDRDQVLAGFRREDVWPMFHYVPLHSSPAGRRFGRVQGEMAVTDTVARQLIRLPFWTGISEAQQARVVEMLIRLLH
jgi:dTDP-4-amino-4,6-dideoxygalactose transaminase